MSKRIWPFRPLTISIVSIHTLFALSTLALTSGCGNSSETESQKDQWQAPPLSINGQSVQPAAPGPIPEAPKVPTLAATTLVISVNGQVLTGGALETLVQRQIAPLRTQIPPAQLPQYLNKARNRVVTEFVTRNLILAELDKQNITVSAEELHNELTRSLPPGVTAADAAKRLGLTEVQLKKNLELRIRSHKLFESALKLQIVPTEEELKAEFEKNKASFNTPSTAHARHILISSRTDPKNPRSPLLDEATRNTKKQKLEELRVKLLAEPDKFGDYAKLHSHCPSAARGGDLGTFRKGQMAKKFEEASFSQEINTIGPVIETEFGYHIVQVLKRSAAEELTFEQAQGRISAQLEAQLREKNQPAVTAYLRDLEKKADITYGTMLKRNPYPGEQKPPASAPTPGPNSTPAADKPSPQVEPSADTGKTTEKPLATSEAK